MVYGKNAKKLKQLLKKSIAKKSKAKKGLLFSAGVDSLLLAMLLKEQNVKFTCFHAYIQGLGKPKDLGFVKKAAKQFNLNLETVPIKMQQLPSLIQEVVSFTNSTSPVTVGIALPLYAACKRAKEAGVKEIFSGQGADELFGGYARFRSSSNFKRDSKAALEKLLEEDIVWNKAIAAANGLKLETPFLASPLIKFAFSIPKNEKIFGKRNKVVLRNLLLSLGAGKEFAERKKLAAQYGSNFDKALEKLAKQAGAENKSAYLKQFEKMKIAALFSGGKDSCLALWKMQQQNHRIECLVSIIPENADSFMYHKPNEKILKMQAKALDIPLLLKRTKGKKEKELRELKLALQEAKKKFEIHGVVSGALYSNYQRQRIQKICSNLGLKLFSPLWHMGQEKEMKELLQQGFVFVMTKIAAMGLGEEWLGRPIGKKEICKLQKLNEKIGFNVGGEGGEYESLVLDAPNFSKKIEIKGFEKKMQNDFTGWIKIMEVSLKSKN